MNFLDDPVNQLLRTWAECDAQAIQDANIERNVASLEAIPWSIWLGACGTADGAALREALLALAHGGQDVYAYTAGHDGETGPKHYNIWLFDHRFDLMDLNSMIALRSLLGKEVGK